MGEQFALFGASQSTEDPPKSKQDAPMPVATPTPGVQMSTLKDVEDKHFAASVSSDHFYWVFEKSTEGQRAMWSEAEQVDLLLRQGYVRRAGEIWLQLDEGQVRVERLALTSIGKRALRRWSHMKLKGI